MRLFILSLLILLMASCSSRYYSGKADYHYDALKFKKAAVFYQKSLNKKSRLLTKVNLVNSYLKIGDYSKALEVLDQLEAGDSLSNDIHVLVSRVLMANGEYQRAEKYLEKVYHSDTSNTLVAGWLSSIRNIDRLRLEAEYKVTDLELGEELSAFSPFIESDMLYFSASGGNKKQDDWNGSTFTGLYRTPLKSDTITAEVLPFKNTFPDKYHLATVCFYDKGEGAFFSASQPLQKGLFLKAEMSETVPIGLYHARQAGGKWTDINMLPFVDEQYSYMHPAWDEKNQLLYFASDQPGGHGGFDIYYVKKEGKSWSKPKNAGENINTQANELFPFVGSDSILYFSSEGHINMGGLDILRSRIKGSGDYGAAENVKSPLNSPKDDFGVYGKDARSGYFSSNRSGKDKIYYYHPLPVRLMIALADIMVTDSLGEPLQQTIIKLNATDSVVTDKEGYVRIPLRNDTLYRFEAKKPGYETYTTELGVPDSLEQDTTVFEIRVVMHRQPEPDREEEKEILLALENIYYDFDEHYIRRDAYEALVKLAAYMKKNPDVTIDMSSHADARGSDTYNMNLSRRRALAAIAFLAEQGIDPDRVRAYYFGERLLVNQCNDSVICSEQAHQLNRRTMFNLNGIDEELIKTYSAEEVDIKPSDLQSFITDQQNNKHVAVASSWYAVAGSFCNENNAKRLKKNLEEQGFTDVLIFQPPNVTQYWVAVEKYGHYKQAMESFRALKEKHPQLDVWLSKQR